MKSLYDQITQYHQGWLDQEKLQLLTIEQAAADLVTADKTHPARKPHLQRMRQAQKKLETAGDQCILCIRILESLETLGKMELSSAFDAKSDNSSDDLPPEIRKILSSILPPPGF